MADLRNFTAKRISLVLFFVLCCALGSRGGRVALIAEDSVYTALSAKIDRLEADLAGDGLEIEMLIYTSGTADDVRNVLIGLYNEPDSLEGALLIGDIPVHMFEVSQVFSPNWEMFACDLFYMDMNGMWSDTMTVSPFRAGVNDTWSEASNETIEIWVSRIKTDNLDKLGTETDLMEAYLDRNHADRSDVMNPLRGHEGLIYNDNGYDDGYWDSPWLWVNDDIANLERVLGEGSATAVYNEYVEDTTRADFLIRVMQDYHAVMIRSHGGYSTQWQQGYQYFRNLGVKEYVYVDDLAATTLGARVYSLFVCKGAAIEKANCLASAYAFHPQGDGLIAVAASKTIERMLIANSNCEFFNSLAARHSIGQSFVSWFNQANIQPYNHYGMILLGDASLCPQRWNYLHFSAFAANWGRTDCNESNENCSGWDVNGSYYWLPGFPDHNVDVHDLVYLVDEMDMWLD